MGAAAKQEYKDTHPSSKKVTDIVPEIDLILSVHRQSFNEDNKESWNPRNPPLWPLRVYNDEYTYETFLQRCLIGLRERCRRKSDRNLLREGHGTWDLAFNAPVVRTNSDQILQPLALCPE
jgi:hypothetical protein